MRILRKTGKDIKKRRLENKQITADEVSVLFLRVPGFCIGLDNNANLNTI